MFQGSGPSWRMTIDEPEDLHLALFVRDAVGLMVRGVPGVPGALLGSPQATHPLPDDEVTAVTLDWGRWWRAIIDARRATSGEPPSNLTAKQRMSWIYDPRAAVGSPPDFEGLSHAPELKRLVASVYRDRFAAWWQGALPEDTQPESGLLDEDMLLDESIWRVSGARGDLVAALRSPTFIPHEVVAEVQQEKQRPVVPFSLTVNVMAVQDSAPTLVASNYVLVPVALYREPTLYRAWLRTVVRAIA